MSERGTGHLQQTLGMWVAVVACLIVGVAPILTPRAPSGDDPGAISVDRAREHVGFIAQDPHVMGTPEIVRVREYLVASLAGVGLQPEMLTIEVPDYFGSSGGTVDITDVLVRIPGTEDDTAVLLMAHYDTVPATPGANDNSAAVAALLEVSRILATEPPPNDVIILFTDGEEPTPRFGAWGFAEYHPWFHDVALAVNFEGISVAGPSILVEISGPKGELIPHLADAVPDLVAYSFMTRTADLIGGAATDFDVFRDRDVPGYNFTYMRGSSIYHTPRDSIDNLNIDGLAHHGSLALGIARNPGPLEEGQLDSDGDVFFTVPFDLVVVYSTPWTMVSLLGTLLLLAGALRTRVTRHGQSLRSILSGLGPVLVMMAVFLMVATFTWIGLVNVMPEMGLVEAYIYLGSLVGLACGAWYLALRWSGHRGSDAIGGLLIVWLGFALLMGSLVPAIGYLFVWPAIGIGIAQVSGAGSRSYGARLVAVVVVGLITFIVLVPAIDIFFQFASPRPGNPGSEMPAAIAVPALLILLGIGLIATSVSEPARPNSA